MDNARSKHPEATFREASPAKLIQDVLRVGPAPNPSREAFATVVNVALVGTAVVLLQPEPAVSGVLVAIIAAFTAIRWVVGARKWGRQ